MKLPKLKYADNIRETKQLRFGGVNATKYAAEGEIYDMENITSQDFPLLSARDKRSYMSVGENIKAVGNRWIIKGTQFIYDEEVKNDFLPLSDTAKKVVEMGNYILIFPDKYYFNTAAYTPLRVDMAGNEYYQLTIDSVASTGEKCVLRTYEHLREAEIEALEGRYIVINSKRYYIEKATPSGGSGSLYSAGITIRGRSGEEINISQGDIIYADKGFAKLELEVGSKCVIAGEEEYIPILTNIRNDGLDIGDSIYIEHGKLKQSAVVEAISFRENGTTDEQKASFPQGSLSWQGFCSAKRKIPDFDCVFAHDNRLWGTAEGIIYASKLGDPKNFYVYAGLSTDSWTVELGNKEIIAGTVYNGKPTFWTPDSVIVVYGSGPSTYQTTETKCTGVLSPESIENVAGYMFYLSSAGVMVYGGQYPDSIHGPIGKKFDEGYGFTDGKRYYISAKIGNNYRLYAYDTETAIWTIEDDLRVVNHDLHDGKLRVVTADGSVVMFPPALEGTDEEEISSYIEFADFYEQSGNKKSMHKLNIRLELESGAQVTVKVKYDGGEWQSLRTVTAENKRSYYIPLIPHRCDHYRLKFEGTGKYTIYSITRETSTGSAL